ncbi:DUF397 domain-containing protein [Streptomyces sp. NPDC001231]|uniref:DUF397 domain-containing protein n=1 Tax=Streptomyces sp. NPDC001231 TaxID=3364549 RepID=UPI0036974D57
MSTDELAWFKSSYSSSGDGDCVEVALAWCKSTYSGEDSGDCVEVAACPAAIHVRDSKNTAGARLALSPTAWSVFTGFTAGGRHG